MKRLADWWGVHFLFAEFSVALVVALAFGVWHAAPGGGRVVAQTLAGNRAAVYGALTSLFGALLGFTIAAMAIVLGYASDNRLRLVRESPHYPTLWRIFIAATRALALATAAALLGLVLDRDRAPSPLILDLAVGATALAALRLARCLWVFERSIGLITERPGAGERRD
ncbi:MAG TPA: hypothetical protein VGR57_08855 [Ktedonobacterales bacterium]|nr:hypothetical protein [Ktedonobacterales bacterium]